jgi:hypothetical protein
MLQTDVLQPGHALGCDLDVRCGQTIEVHDLLLEPRISLGFGKVCQRDPCIGNARLLGEMQDLPAINVHLHITNPIHKGKALDKKTKLKTVDQPDMPRVSGSTTHRAKSNGPSMGVGFRRSILNLVHGLPDKLSLASMSAGRLPLLANS